jgi:erythromycin esterase
MINRFLIITILLFFAKVVCCQNDIKTQIVNNFHQVNSIDPLQTDYADLESFGNAIGNSQIVFLGEQDHGDAPTFLAKTRLIKFLHEKKGFDVLAFESDFWGLNVVWDNRKRDTFSINQIKDNTFSVWSKCQQTQELYGYIDQSLKTNNPLIVSGFDCQQYLPYSKDNFIKALKAFTRTQNLCMSDTSSLIAFLKITEKLIEKEYNGKEKKAQKTFFLHYLDKIGPTITDPFWKQEFISLKGLSLSNWIKCNSRNDTIRDVYMAKNLLWLYKEKYRGKKIIVWAHSAHIAKNINLTSSKAIKNEPSTSMGNEVFHSLKDSIYVLGFASLTGKAGRITYDAKYDVQKAKPNSFETWVDALNYDYGFINFKALKNNSPFYMKGLLHYYDNIDWTKLFDGVFYIKNMYPCDIAK